MGSVNRYRDKTRTWNSDCNESSYKVLDVNKPGALAMLDCIATIIWKLFMFIGEHIVEIKTRGNIKLLWNNHYLIRN